jgi:hypothetical protein
MRPDRKGSLHYTLYLEILASHIGDLGLIENIFAMVVNDCQEIGER